MSRSKWKGNFIDKSLFRLKEKLSKMTNDEKKKFQIVIKSRSSVIPQFLVGYKVQIHNGFVKVITDDNGKKTFEYKSKPVLITEKHVGFKFGEFSLTRQPHIRFKHKKANKKPVKKTQ